MRHQDCIPSQGVSVVAMGFKTGPLQARPAGKECVEWVRKYMKDCICSLTDEISFALGFTSVLCWGLAEIPQIITNCKEKTTEGVSLPFLLTWVVGDIFNIVGCYLEPSTLPTQFLAALLYTVTTLILVGQVIYYNHIEKWRKENMAKPEIEKQVNTEDSTITKSSRLLISSNPIPAVLSPRHITTLGRDLYIRSARTLVSSHSPTASSYLVDSQVSVRRSTASPLHYSLPSDELNQVKRMSNSYSPATVYCSPVLRAVVSSALCFVGFNIHSHLRTEPVIPGIKIEFFVLSGRKLLEGNYLGHHSELQNPSSQAGGGAIVGLYLGWLMAAIYMGGRLPQIWLNIKRGTVEGLNPLMFLLALLGNATYVASILVRSMEWEKTRPNLPWLIDAGVCVLLDVFILCQFFYYSFRRPRGYDEYKPLS